MSLASEQNADLSYIFAELGETFTFGAATIPCSVTFRSAGRKNDIGGFLDEFDVTISARVLDLPTPAPARGSVVVHRSRSYRVEQIDLSQINTEARLKCVATNR